LDPAEREETRGEYQTITPAEKTGDKAQRCEQAFLSLSAVARSSTSDAINALTFTASLAPSLPPSLTAAPLRPPPPPPRPPPARLDSTSPADATAIEGWIIIVTNVHEEANEDDLMDRFSDYGTVKNLHLNLDRRTGFIKVRAALSSVSLSRLLLVSAELRRQVTLRRGCRRCQCGGM